MYETTNRGLKQMKKEETFAYYRCSKVRVSCGQSLSSSRLLSSDSLVRSLRGQLDRSLYSSGKQPWLVTKSITLESFSLAPKRRCHVSPSGNRKRILATFKNIRIKLIWLRGRLVLKLQQTLGSLYYKQNKTYFGQLLKGSLVNNQLK